MNLTAQLLASLLRQTTDGARKVALWRQAERAGVAREVLRLVVPPYELRKQMRDNTLKVGR